MILCTAVYIYRYQVFTLLIAYRIEFIARFFSKIECPWRCGRARTHNRRPRGVAVALLLVLALLVQLVVAVASAVTHERPTRNICTSTYAAEWKIFERHV